MRVSLDKSRESTALIGKYLGEIGTTFSQRIEQIKMIGDNSHKLVNALKSSSTEIQSLIQFAEATNANILQSYIGFFNYLNEFSADVEQPLDNIKVIFDGMKPFQAKLDELKKSAILPADDKALVDSSTELSTEIFQNLRRYRRFMRELGETTSTTQISELRHLATRTAQSTRDIEDIVSKVHGKIGPTVAEIEGSSQRAEEERQKSDLVAQKLNIINDAIAQLSDQVAVIARSTEQQDQTFPEITRSINAISMIASDSRSLSENREPTAEKPFWPDFPIKFVKYAQYLPHLIEKSGSKWLSLATAPILGQAPSDRMSDINNQVSSLVDLSGQLQSKISVYKF